jgi:hypothetical protein
MVHRELPDDVIGVIREYAKPMTRADWRTCKIDESRPILLLHKGLVYIIAEIVGIEFCDLIVRHSLYSLMAILDVHRN